MQTKHFFPTLAFIIALFVIFQNAEAQKIKPLSGPNYIPIKTSGFGGGGTSLPCLYCDWDTQDDTTGLALIKCNTDIEGASHICDSLSTNGYLGVNFYLSSTTVYFGDTMYISGREKLTNNSSCNENFVTCSMVEYAAPEMAQNHLDSNYFPNPDTLGDSVLATTPDAFGTTVVCWTMTPNTCDSCPTGCNYTCSPMGSAFLEDWSYYFGCQNVNIPPGETVFINTGWNAVVLPLLATHDAPAGYPDSGTEVINLSTNPANLKDSSISTWNYNGFYVDFLKGCNFLSMNGCDFGDEPGQEVVLDSSKLCTQPVWYKEQRLYPTAYHGRSYPTGIVSFPIGNQLTSTMSDTNNAHTVYQAEFVGSLVGAPAGSELMIYAPEDTSNGSAVIDSGWLWTDTISGCQSDTLKFEFPFVIPPEQYLDRGMTFIVYFPSDSCSNVGNGKRLHLNGQVYANAMTPLYDSGAFMYHAQSVMVLDTTPPVITSFVAVAVDSTHLAINMTGIDDTTMVTAGYAIYTINGGAQKFMPLRFSNNIAVGDTSTFVDTLISPVSHPIITIKGFVQNEVGLTDSSSLGIFPLKAQQGNVNSLQADSLKVNYLMIDHQAKILTLDIQAVGTPLELDLVSESGQSSTLTSESSSPNGEQKFIQSLSNFANGAYFLVIHSGNNSIIENIIL